MLNDSNASILSRWFSRKSGKKPKSSRCTKPLLEFLEDRTAPATLSEVGGTLTINLDNAGEQLRVVSNGVTYALTSNFNFVNDGTNPVTTAPPTDFVTGFGTMTASVTAAGLMAYDTINVVDSAQNTSVRFNGGDYQDDFTITLDDDTDVGVGELASVSFNNATNFGSADVTISTTRNVQFAPANLTIVTFTSGNLDIEANTAGTTTGDFNGIQLSSTTIDSTSGNITMEGHGGTAAGNQDGVSINGTPITTTSGAITLNGTATGNNTGSGVRIFNGADLTTDTGAVLITGNSEGDAGIILTGASSANLATIMTSATTAGQGNITLLGAGEGGVALSDAELTTDAGQIQVTGNADTVTDGNQGITIFGNSVLTTIGTGANAGNIILNGTGGTPPIMGASASGISIGNIGSDSLTITTVDGDISFTGNATRDAGVTYNRGQIIESTGAGSITFMGTAMTAEANFGVFVAAPVATNSGTIMITGSSEGPATGDTGVSIVDMVTSTTGAIVIDGTADNTNGVSLLGTSGTEVSTGGTTGISITGTSNSATPTDAGVFLAGNPLVTTSTNAPINIVGNGPLGLVMGNPMSFTPGAPMITSTGGGDITISGDDVQMNNNAEINTPGTVRMAITGDVTQDISGAGFLDPRIITPSLGITATGNVDLQSINQVDTLAIDAGGSVDFNNTGAVTIGTVSASAPFTGETGVTTTNGSISITADGTLTAAEVVNAGGTGSNVNLTTTSSGDVIVDNVQAVNDQITIIADGAIVEETPADGGVDLVASTINLTAETGIGTMSEAIEINASVMSGMGLTATVNTAGPINVRDFNGLNVTSATTNDGDITISAGGVLRAESVIAGGSGNVDLTATGSNVAVGVVTAMGDDVTIDAASAITDLNGPGTLNITSMNLLLEANDNISTNICVDNVQAISATGTISLRTHKDVNVADLGGTPMVGLSTSGSNSITLDDQGGPFTYTLVIADGISDNSPVILNDGANLDLNNADETIGSLAGDGDVFLGSGTLTTGSAGSSTYNGNISGSGGLTKVGGTTFTLNGDHTYTGLTSIDAGTLTLNGTLGGTANVELNASGTTLNGTGSITDRLIQLNGGFNNMSVSGSLNLTNAGNTVVNVIGSGSVRGATIESGTIGIDVTSTGAVSVSMNTLNDNTTGINVASGGTVFFENGNVINGGTTGLLVTGPTPFGTGIGNLTLANTVWTGQTTYISLQNQAHESPEVIDGTATTFDGNSAATIDGNEALRDAWELQVDHFPDDNELGLIILKTDTAYIDPNSNDLIVIGSFGRDRITINSRTDRAITVRTNLFRGTFDLSPFPDAHIVVFGLNDRDFISLTGTRSNEVFAGNGNDTIYGGDADDVLRGEGGNDFINGRAGNDVILGGFGNDTLYASQGDDILAGGHIIRPYDELIADLTAWVGGSSIMTALAGFVTDLTDPEDSSNRDRLVGYSTGREAFVRRSNDVLSGFSGLDEDWTNW